MNYILPFLLLIPLIGLVIGFFFNNKDEKAIYGVTVLGVSLNFILLLLLVVGMFQSSTHSLHYIGPVLYEQANTAFGINLYVDVYSMVYLLVATFLTTIILIFSRTYVHREKGFKRFFNNVKFFYIGLLVILLSGNLETLFIGWEILGVTSFFLIGFYRERYLPVKNALKVVSLYRVADIALLLGIWISHHYYGHSINFWELGTVAPANHHLLSETYYSYFIPATFLVAAMVKSAQFPFSSWLPRAMEGPTTSSAIFYGSLSVHIGVFLLIRTAPFWESNLIFHFIIGGIGLITFLMASSITSVQSTIKTQIGYSSIAQIGLMFIEVSLGWYGLALIHFACNAMFRSYQLLLSPSVLSYKIHDQFFHFEAPKAQKTDTLWDKIKLSLYVLSIKEFNLDYAMYSLLWNPLKKMGNLFKFLNERNTYIIALPPFLMGLYGVYHQELLPQAMQRFLPELFAVVGFVFILRAFVERQSALNSWVLIIINQLYLSLAFGYNEQFDFSQVHIYLSGVFISGLLGVYGINKLREDNEDVSLNQFHGHSYVHPRLALLFVVACLGLAGFPITPTFIGEDLLLGHIHENQVPLLIFIVMNLILDGLVIFRIYSRLFLGPHITGYHEVAYRSS